ncbi:protein tyrosine phosphatase receptor type Fa isoform X2 [Stigmatopora nigra]
MAAGRPVAVTLAALLLSWWWWCSSPCVAADGVPSLVKWPQDQTGVAGGVASFVCQAQGEPRPRITWMKQGKKVSSQRFEVMDFPDGSGSVLRIQPLRTHRDEAVYECAAANALGRINASAKLTVLEEEQIPHGFPSIDMGPQLKVVEKTRTATMLCAASGSPDPLIFWLKDFLPVDVESADGRVKQLRSGGTPIRGALQIENSDESDQGKYECVAVNSAGSRYSPPANLYVRDQREVRRVPPRFSIPPSNREVLPGGAVNLTCVAVGAPMPRVKWMSGEAQLTPEDQVPVGRNVLQLAHVLRSADYTCVAVSTLGVIRTTARVTVKAPPKPPTSLTATETTATSVTLSWDSEPSEPPASYYVIQYRALSSGEDVFREVDGVATTRYSVGGLGPFSEYLFRVMAVNEVGRGPPGPATAVRTGERAPSSPPLRLRARASGPARLLVRWEPPEEPNGRVRGYRLYYSADPEAPPDAWERRQTTAADGAGGAGGLALDGLRADVTYRLRVLAFTSAGDGPPSDVVLVKTREGVPAQPSHLEAEAELDSRIMLSWRWPPVQDVQEVQEVQEVRHPQEPQEAQEPLLGYQLLYWEANLPQEKLSVNLEPSASYAVDNLKADTVYAFSLAAKSASGLGVFTAPVEGRTAPSMPEAPPRKVEAAAVNSTAVRVSWKPPLSIKHNGHLRGGYHIVYSRMERGQPHGRPLVADVARPDAQEAILTGLLPETSYSLTVAAYGAKGDGARSKARLVTTTGAVPGKPSMMISTTTSNTALIQWQPPKETAGQLTGYRLRYKRAEEDSFAVRDFGPSHDHFTVTGLHKGASYVFQLRARNGAGHGVECVKEVATPEDAPSGYPLNLSAVGLGATSARLTWEPPSAERRNGKMVEYAVVYRDIDGREEEVVRTTAHTHLSLSGLRPDTTYDIRVRAFTAKGGGPLSPGIQSRTMPAPVPASAHNLAAKTVTKTSVLLTWEVTNTSESDSPLQIVFERQSVATRLQDGRKLITGLRPDTEYSFSVPTNGGAGPRQTVTLRTAPDLLPEKPSEILVDAEEDGGKVALRLPRVASGSPVRWFYVVVVPLTPASVHWESPDAMDLQELLDGQDIRPRKTRQTERDFLRAYVAAKLSSLPDVFTLGDGRDYGGFRNRQLLPGTARFFVLAELAQRQWRTLASSPFSDDVSVNDGGVGGATRVSEEGQMLWVTGPVLAVVLIVVIVMAILLFKSKQERKRTSPSSKDAQAAAAATDTKDSLRSRPCDPPEARPPGDNRGTPTLPGTGGRPPIAVGDLADHIRRLEADENSGFSREYQSIEAGRRFTWEHSNLEVNKPKNRYANIVAYDHTRVLLTPTEGMVGSDYVNANYVDGYRKQNAYIATQGPLPDTLADFWRMVWEQRAATVVMMTRLEEKSRVKCEQYWPSRGTQTYGPVQVTLLETTELATYTIRTFALYKSGSSERREVRHFQFLAWPDHGVPEHPASTLAFVRRVKACDSPDAGPTVVHCSAGVGRTGCFVAIDAMLERMRREGAVDVHGHVSRLRAQRNYMVQTQEQYVFIHEALLEAAVCGNTQVAARNLHAHVDKLGRVPPGESVTAMELEFKKLSRSKWPGCRSVSGNLPCNKSKNRLENVVPLESSRVCLQPVRGVEGSDYINASLVDGYRQRGAYVATQGPLAHTADDFWRMLWERNSTIVVMLTKLREMGREKCHQYWPAERSARYQYFVVDPMAEYNMPQYVLREFKVTDARDGQSRTIRQFQFSDWPEQGVPENGEGFIDFIGQVHKTKEQFGQEGPITVHCSAGVGRSGVFITLSMVLERMRYEGVVDVFHTVQTLRTQRPAMVQTQEQYQLCYRAALQYLGSFDHYAT